jgi:hypothetical protein
MTERRHSATGERFNEMTEEQLSRVIRRTYRFAADKPADARAAQTELRRRGKTERSKTE